MAFPQTGEDELAEMQKLSNEYEPETKGPLVGERQLSKAITTEYAAADPVYQAKTAALPNSFSHYRTIRGDGKCGWRAVAFGYFEALIRTQDAQKFLVEEARLRSLSNVIDQAGFDSNLFEDFADETFGLLRKLADDLHAGQVEHELLQRFNDDDLQNYIITHLRTLTAAWMKTHEDEYSPWLMDQTVHQYCDSTVQPVSAEIDHVGLSALKDVLLSPADIALEVHYLDRSEGTEVTMHRFDPVNSTGLSIGTVRLLYRPGHYDLLYKLDETVPVVPPPVSAFLTVPSHAQPHVYGMGADVADLFTMIPGMSFAPSENWMSAGYSSDFFPLARSEQQQCTEAMPTPTGPPAHPQPMYAAVPTSASQQLPASCRTSSDLPMHLLPDGIHQSEPLAAHLSQNVFRPSTYEFKPDLIAATTQRSTVKSAIFRNSYYNPAHFLNPEFQPEQWDPYGEYSPPSSSGKSSRPKSIG